MIRYAAAAVLLAAFVNPAMAQYPITGAFPPWSAGTPPSPAYSPKEVPILTQTPVRFMITEQLFTDLKGIVPDLVLTKLNPLKGKIFSQNELMVLLNEGLKPDEVVQWKEYIISSAQISAPRQILLPAGKPLTGYYKMDGLLVGADGRYPFDSGEYNLAGYAGNARIYGTFEITLPAPANIDPLNKSVYYRPVRGFCQQRR